jgi:ornithine cyclodeaminase/alanine dehydrogenase-like protein (mu-crystallin family)
MVAPSRFRVDVDQGALISTAGAVTHDDKAVADADVVMYVTNSTTPVFDGR